MTVDFAKLKAPLTARWFDPTSGESKAIEPLPFPNTRLREFISPGKNSTGDSDWVLVLESK